MRSGVFGYGDGLTNVKIIEQARLFGINQRYIFIQKIQFAPRAYRFELRPEHILNPLIICAVKLLRDRLCQQCSLLRSGKYLSCRSQLCRGEPAGAALRKYVEILHDFNLISEELNTYRTFTARRVEVYNISPYCELSRALYHFGADIAAAAQICAEPVSRYFCSFRQSHTGGRKNPGRNCVLKRRVRGSYYYIVIAAQNRGQHSYSLVLKLM